MFSHTRRVALLLFGSGFCALIYQTTWLREFRLIFGASTAASAAVLGVFMAGLGFGGIILGRRSETKARPLAFYARLELLIAGTAAISPLLIVLARYLYIACGGTHAMGIFLGTVVRLVLAAIIVGVPAFLMGGTLPAAVRAVIPSDDSERRSIGIVYGVNTLGAVTGVALGTFYSFEHFGNRTTLWLAATVNVVVALIALFSAKAIPDLPATRRRKEVEGKIGAATNPSFILGAAALVGCAFFLMEMVWYRMLSPLLGGSTFSFGMILAVALLGIGLGGAAYALFGLKRSASLQVLALTCGAEAFFIALPYALGDRLAMVAMLLRPLGTLGFHGHVLAWTALCLIIVFPAALISGVQFPLMIALLGKGRMSVGSQTGAAYAWNTIGALVGSLAGGFGLIPLLSAPGVWKFVVLLLAALVVVAISLDWRTRPDWRGVLLPLATVALALWMLMAIGPTAFWRHSGIGVGRFTRFQDSPNQLRDLVQGTRLQTIWEKDGRESGVALVKPDSLAFVVNGKSDGNAKEDAGTQVMCGLMGAALHPHPTKALVVGLGTGSTAGWLAAIPSIQKVDVVELEPAILTVAENCTAVNHDALHNPKVHIMIGDAREVLLTSREKYDLIASEPSNPYRAGVAGLFTREFYESVEKRLEPGGMFVQWMQAYDIDDRTVRILYRTLGSVFPNIESWQPIEGDLLLVSSRQAVRYDMPALRARLAEEPFKSALPAVWRADGLEDFLAHYVGNSEVAETLQHLGSDPLNTDDRTVIEFALARSINVANGFQIASLRASTHAAQVDRPRVSEGEVDWPRVDEARLSMYLSLNRAEQFIATFSTQQRIRAAAFASYMQGDLPDALRQWRTQAEEPKTLSELALLSECLADQGEEGALPYISRLADVLPADAEAIRAAFWWRERRGNDATEGLDRFFHALLENPWPEHELIKRSLLRASEIASADPSKRASLTLYDALRAPFSVYNNEGDRLANLLRIGLYLDGDAPGKYTLAALKFFEPSVPFRRQFLQVRKDCYNAMHSPMAEKANRDFDDFVRHEASAIDVPTLTKAIEERAR